MCFTAGWARFFFSACLLLALGRQSHADTQVISEAIRVHAQPDGRLALLFCRYSCQPIGLAEGRTMEGWKSFVKDCRVEQSERQIEENVANLGLLLPLLTAISVRGIIYAGDYCGAGLNEKWSGLRTVTNAVATFAGGALTLRALNPDPVATLEAAGQAEVVGQWLLKTLDGNRQLGVETFWALKVGIPFCERVVELRERRRMLEEPRIGDPRVWKCLKEKPHWNPMTDLSTVIECQKSVGSGI